MLIKNEKLLLKNAKNGKVKTFWLKTRHFGKFTAFDENHGFHDFRVFMIFYY